MSKVRIYRTPAGTMKVDWTDLARSLREKETPRLVAHGHPVLSSQPLWTARDFVRDILTAKFWASLAAAAWLLLGSLVLWWLPVRPKGIDLAYLIPLTATVALYQGIGAVQAARLKKKLREVVTALMNTGATREPGMAPPAYLLADEKAPSPRKHHAFVAAAALLLFVTTIGQAAIPIPGYWAVITPPGGEQQAARTITRLGPGDRWQLAPTHISGYVYGVVSYDEPTQKLLVVRFDYSMDNPTGMLAPTEVKEKMNAYASNMAHSIGTNLDAAAPVGMDRLDWSYSALQGDSQIAQLLEGAVRTAASTQFKSSTSVRASFVVISLAEYRKHLSK